MQLEEIFERLKGFVASGIFGGLAYCLKGTDLVVSGYSKYTKFEFTPWGDLRPIEGEIIKVSVNLGTFFFIVSMGLLIATILELCELRRRK